MAVLTKVRLRELARSKWQYLAVGVVIVLGIAVFSATRSLYINLERSYAESYARLKFEEFGIRFSSAPQRAADRLLTVPGVVAVEGRLTEEAIVKIVGRDEKLLLGRLISAPAERRPTVNDLLVVDGRYLNKSRQREALLEYSFARHHGLKPGDQLEISRGSGKGVVKVVGIVQSPEFLYVVRSKQELFPATETYGVMFLSHDTLGALVGKAGTINEIRARVDDASKLESAMLECRRLLSAYGPEDPVRRQDQPSEAFLRQDLEGFQLYSVIFPAFFLTIAALTIHTLLNRMVQLQRPMIGLLRALGFTRRQVALHYVWLAMTFGLSAVACGAVLGLYFARIMTFAYMSELTVPHKVVEPHWPTLGLGGLIGLAFCLAAAWSPAWAAAKTSPVEALRGAAQGGGRVIRLDRLFPGLKLMWRIPLRNLSRQPRRTFSTLLGVVASVTLLLLARGMSDTVSSVLTNTLASGFKEDLRVEFLSPGASSNVAKVRSWPGVVWAEGELSLAAEFRKGDSKYEALLVGVPSVPLLREFVGLDGSVSQAFKNGAIFGPTLRRRLQLEIGDTVSVSLPREETDQRARVRLIRVAGFTKEPIGTMVYMPMGQLRDLFHTEANLPLGAVSSIRVKTQPNYRDQVRERLEDLPGAAAVTSAADLRKTLVELMKTFQGFVWVIQLFGIALAFSIVFNTVSVSVLERAQEIASMRTIGMSRVKVAGMVTMETLVVSLVGVAIGLPVGRWFIDALFVAAQTPEQMDLFVMRATVFPATYAWAAILGLAAPLASQIPAIRYVNHLDLSRAIKERSQ